MRLSPRKVKRKTKSLYHNNNKRSVGDKSKRDACPAAAAANLSLKENKKHKRSRLEEKVTKLLSQSTSSVSSLATLFNTNNAKSSRDARARFKDSRSDEFLKAKKVSEASNQAMSTDLTFDLCAKDKRLALLNALKCFDKEGVAIFTGGLDTHNESTCSHTHTILRPELLNELRQAAVSVKEKVCNRLKEINIRFETDAMLRKSCNNSSGRYVSRAEKLKKLREIQAREEESCFKFLEASSRCLGRIDISLVGELGSYPFNSNELTHHPEIMQLARAFLGENCVLSYVGLVLSFPGSADQPFHEDGEPLFQKTGDATRSELPESFCESNVQCPPHAINVFIPLNDVTNDLGPTEFLVSSHLVEKRPDIEHILEKGAPSSIIENPEGSSYYRCRLRNAVGPLLKAGSALLYDYRVIHRGTGNLSGDLDSCRYMLYMLYSRPWFKDHVNFGKTSIFSPEAEKQTLH